MPTNCLTDARCRAEKPGATTRKVFDGQGLYLFISTSGAKLWRMTCRINGKPQTLSFGPYPDVSLVQAREKRDAARAALREGRDPRPKKKSAGKQFGEGAIEYWKGRQDVSESYRKNAMRGLEMHLEKLWETPIADITRDMLLAELNVMNARGLFVYVRKVRLWAGLVFEWAIEQKFTDANPAGAIRPKRAFGKAKVRHMPALAPSEVETLMSRLALEPATLTSVLACRFLAYTWVRTNELRMMEWTELDGDLWRLPEGKMKRPFDHLVPLPKQALAVLKEMRARSRGGRFVFESDHNKDRPISENAILYLLYRIGFKDKMTGHGWRSVGSTWANENEYNADAIERQLAHIPKNTVRSSYNRAAYLPQRKKMLQDWADWLDRQVNPSLL